MLTYQRLQMDTQSLIFAFKEHGIDLTCGMPPASFNLENSSEIANAKFNEFAQQLPKKNLAAAQSKQKTLLGTIAQMQKEYTRLNTRVLSTVASALISLNRYSLSSTLTCPRR